MTRLLALHGKTEKARRGYCGKWMAIAEMGDDNGYASGLRPMFFFFFFFFFFFLFFFFLFFFFSLFRDFFFFLGFLFN